MQHTFTQNDLVAFAYRETPTRLTRVIETALLKDADLRAEYTELVGTSRELNQLRFDAPILSRQLILLHSSMASEEAHA